MNSYVRAFNIMKIIKEEDQYNQNDIVIIEFLTYYKSKFLTIKNIIYLYYKN